MTVQLPVDVNDKVFPVTVQLSDAVNVTVSPDVDEAESVNGPGSGCLAIAAMVIVCKVFVTVKVLGSTPCAY